MRIKTRRLTDVQLAKRLQEGCPSCGAPLTVRTPFKRDESTGRSYPAGAFYGCKDFGKACDVKYYVNLKGDESVIPGIND